MTTGDVMDSHIKHTVATYQTAGMRREEKKKQGDLVDLLLIADTFLFMGGNTKRCTTGMVDSTRNTLLTATVQVAAVHFAMHHTSPDNPDTELIAISGSLFDFGWFIFFIL